MQKKNLKVVAPKCMWNHPNPKERRIVAPFATKKLPKCLGCAATAAGFSARIIISQKITPVWD
jgi:hypothetical protein